jgi:hypothetical protein
LSHKTSDKGNQQHPVVKNFAYVLHGILVRLVNVSKLLCGGKRQLEAKVKN